MRPADRVDDRLQARSGARSFFEGEADGLEGFVAFGGEKKKIAAEFVLGDAEDVRRRPAHGGETGEVNREFVDAVEVELEFDEAGERGLIQRIGGDGACERLAGCFAGVDLHEAAGNREQIFGAEG